MFENPATAALGEGGGLADTDTDTEPASVSMVRAEARALVSDMDSAMLLKLAVLLEALSLAPDAPLLAARALEEVEAAIDKKPADEWSVDFPK